MLSTAPVVAFLATANPEQAHTFYADVLRLPLVRDEPSRRRVGT